VPSPDLSKKRRHCVLLVTVEGEINVGTVTGVVIKIAMLHYAQMGEILMDLNAYSAQMEEEGKLIWGQYFLTIKNYFSLEILARIP